MKKQHEPGTRRSSHVATIFVSSTFKDMDAERDHLRQFVIPKLEEHFQKKGIQVRMIDLRAGIITDTAQSDQNREAKILKVCFDEINRSRPFFIALLGERYGWVPPADRLQFVNREFSKDKQYFGFDPSILEGKSVTHLEILFGALGKTNPSARSLFCFRDPGSHEGLPEELHQFFDKDDPKKSAQLKADILAKYEGTSNLLEYRLEWTKSGFSRDSLDKWGERVYKFLQKEIEAEFSSRDSNSPADYERWSSFYEEERDQSAFIDYHVRQFAGRKEIRLDLCRYINDQTGKLFLTAKSGMGKSAVLCKCYESASLKTDDHTLVLFHSAGISPESRDLKKMLARWNWRICGKLGEEYKEIKEETDDYYRLGFSKINKGKQKLFQELCDQFKELTTKVKSRGIKLVLIIDAFEQFTELSEAEQLSFLSDNVCTIISCNSDSGIVTSLKSIHSESRFVELSPFSEADSRSTIEKICKQNHSNLHDSEELMEKLLKKAGPNGLACSSPLWLNLATNFFSALDVDDFVKIDKRDEKDKQLRIEFYLADLVEDFPGEPGELFLYLIDRASKFYGESLTNECFNYIAITRQGLREKDLAQIQGEGIWVPVNFACLRRWFKTVLVEYGNGQCWYIPHRVLLDSLRDRVRPEKAYHEKIAEYLLSLLPKDFQSLLAKDFLDYLYTHETMYHLKAADRKFDAAKFYASPVKEHLEPSTNVLAESIGMDESALDWIIAMIQSGRKSDGNVLFRRENSHMPQLLKQMMVFLYPAIATRMDSNKRIIFLDAIEKECVALVNKGCAEKEEIILHIYNLLGDWAAKYGKYDRALKSHQKGLRLSKKIWQLSPDDVSAQHRFAIAQCRVGNAFVSQSRWEEAYEHYREFYEMMKALYLTDIQNTLFLRDYGISLNKFVLANWMLARKCEEEWNQRDVALEYSCAALEYANTAKSLWNDLLESAYSNDEYDEYRAKLQFVEEIINCLLHDHPES